MHMLPSAATVDGWAATRFIDTTPSCFTRPSVIANTHLLVRYTHTHCCLFWMLSYVSFQLRWPWPTELELTIKALQFPIKYVSISSRAIDYLEGEMGALFSVLIITDAFEYKKIKMNQVWNERLKCLQHTLSYLFVWGVLSCDSQREREGENHQAHIHSVQCRTDGMSCLCQTGGVNLRWDPDAVINTTTRQIKRSPTATNTRKAQWSNKVQGRRVQQGAEDKGGFWTPDCRVIIRHVHQPFFSAHIWTLGRWKQQLRSQLYFVKCCLYLQYNAATYIKSVHYTVSVVLLTYIGLHWYFLQLLSFFSWLLRWMICFLWAICTFISLEKEPDDHIWLPFFLFNFIWELGMFVFTVDCFVLTHWLKCNVK